MRRFGIEMKAREVFQQWRAAWFTWRAGDCSGEAEWEKMVHDFDWNRNPADRSGGDPRLMSDADYLFVTTRNMRLSLGESRGNAAFGARVAVMRLILHQTLGTLMPQWETQKKQRLTTAEQHLQSLEAELEERRLDWTKGAGPSYSFAATLRDLRRRRWLAKSDLELAKVECDFEAQDVILAFATHAQIQGHGQLVKQPDDPSGQIEVPVGEWDQILKDDYIRAWEDEQNQQLATISDQQAQQLVVYFQKIFIQYSYWCVEAYSARLEEADAAKAFKILMHAHALAKHLSQQRRARRPPAQIHGEPFNLMSPEHARLRKHEHFMRDEGVQTELTFAMSFMMFSLVRWLQQNHVQKKLQEHPKMELHYQALVMVWLIVLARTDYPTSWKHSHMEGHVMKLPFAQKWKLGEWYRTWVSLSEGGRGGRNMWEAEVLRAIQEKFSVINREYTPDFDLGGVL
eukprot:Cvel_30871.t1-p1 / transcript=Cvel_30871.t1 / gene=Cvel_30871 / organism=Chromera_velia_CCMP2878 / gene_product=hypothetical protein / transcript_product=hypothetical protein / location=Cvel_scaffold4484:572-9079(+) / protein_length=456 / sequence_SO=supercontig / SO=protein_coding / is_pseudo=false